MWHEGTIGIPLKDESYKAAHYQVKSYDEPSKKYGINGGRISKLSIRIDGEYTCSYDRGWDIEPEKGSPTELAFCILLENYN